MPSEVFPEISWKTFRLSVMYTVCISQSAFQAVLAVFAFGSSVAHKKKKNNLWNHLPCIYECINDAYYALWSTKYNFHLPVKRLMK
jgi:hypothetical protein